MYAKVLIVDDELMTRQAISDILAQENFLTQTSSSGEGALETLGKEKIDVVLMDYRMPGIDGLGLIRQISEVSPKTKIIVIASFASTEAAVEAFRLHVHDFLLKPVHPSQIINSVKSSLIHLPLQNYSEKLNGIKTFISYAREDEIFAKRLFEDKKKIGLIPWLDTESLIPVTKWKNAISQEIRESRYFVALFSSRSVNKKGFLQKELKEALGVLDEYPETMIYFIPARLDDCVLSHPRVNDLQWVDLFPDWNRGFEKILLAMTSALR